MARKQAKAKPLTCTVEEAAGLLGIGRDRAYRWAAEGKLPVLLYDERQPRERYVLSREGVERMARETAIHAQEARRVSREADQQQR